jgi:hypothetical protein
MEKNAGLCAAEQAIQEGEYCFTRNNETLSSNLTARQKPCLLKNCTSCRMSLNVLYREQGAASPLDVSNLSHKVIMTFSLSEM